MKQEVRSRKISESGKECFEGQHLKSTETHGATWVVQRSNLRNKSDICIEENKRDTGHLV